MSTAPSLRERVAHPDGYQCPRCGEVAEDMDRWMDHVSDAHNVYIEFVERWSRHSHEPDTSPEVPSDD